MNKTLTLNMSDGSEYTFHDDEAVAANKSLSLCVTHDWGNVELKIGSWTIRVFEKHIVSISTKGMQEVDE